MRPFGRGSDSRVASEDGSFEIDELPAGRWAVVVQAKAYEEARVGGIDVEENRTTGGIEIRMSRGSVVLGTVVDDSGRPIIDATVSAVASGGGGRRFNPFGRHTARSHADGAFELRGLNEGTYTITASHVDFADASEGIDLGEGVAQVALRMATGGVFAGTVVAQDQSPLLGAQVVLSAQGGTRSMTWRGGESAITDQAGRFRFDHLVQGRYTIQATYREGASPPVDVLLHESERREDLLIALEAGATIEGFVSGLSEIKLSMVQIWASGQDRYSASTRVGAGGRFELVGVPVGPLTVRASVGNMMAGASRSTMVRAIVPEGVLAVPVEVVFEPGFTLAGIVARGGQPAAQVQVWASSEGSGEHSGNAVTDASGAYSIDGLPPGSYRVSGVSFRETVEISGNTTFDIELPTSSVTGRVVEAASQAPLADVEVSLEGAEASRRRGGVTTDVNGRFSIDGLTAGPYTLTARRASFGFETETIHVEDSATEDLLIELTRAEGVGLRVRDGLFMITLRGVSVRALDGASVTVFSGSIPLDGDGRGEIPGLKPGVYTLVVGSTSYAPLTLPGITAPAPMIDVALTPGGRLEIQVGPETLAKTPRASLSTTSGVPYRSAFGGDGSFRLNAPLRNRDHVAPGSYILTVDGVPTENVQITEGATTVVQLQ